MFAPAASQKRLISEALSHKVFPFLTLPSEYITALLRANSAENAVIAKERGP
jgi:hypothetical protein